jgi:hypothetical protein
MSKFECKRCQGQVCTVELSSGYPAFCVKHSDHDSEWDEITDDAGTEKQEVKLPKWCKLDAWVYDSSNGYGKITSIQEERFFCYIEFDGGAGGFVPESFAKLKQARQHPYNKKEMKALVGKVLEWDSNSELVISYNEASVEVYVGRMWCSAEYLMLSEYKIDGKPCGVLEYLDDNGEWVE